MNVYDKCKIYLVILKWFYKIDVGSYIIIFEDKLL